MSNPWLPARSQGRSGQDLVVWTGPVGLFQVPGCTIPGANNYNSSCCGKPAPSCNKICQEVVWSWSDDQARHLPLLVINAGMPSLEETGDIVLGAFSAGGRVVRETVGNPLDAARVRAVTLADATYAGWLDSSRSQPVVDELWMVWANSVLNSGGQKLWVATASTSPDQDRANGVQVLQAIRRKIEERTGQRFQEIPDFYGISPRPDAAYRLGNIIFAEYAKERVPHGDQVKLQPQIWNIILLPWLAGIKSGVLPGISNSGQTLIETLLYLGVGAGVGYLGYKYSIKRTNT